MKEITSKEITGEKITGEKTVDKETADRETTGKETTGKETMDKIAAGILGASGYSGNELAYLLGRHPNVELKCLQSKSCAGKRIRDIYPSHPSSELDLIYTTQSVSALNELDVVFLALPKEEALVIAPQLKTRIIDLSPAHRFDGDYVYGLPEMNRTSIENARRIANPGCYATTCILGALPIVRDTSPDTAPKFMAFDCKSGYSGGGRSKKYDYEENIVPYSLVDHYQAPELAKFIPCEFSFVPQVVNAFRGLMAIIHVFGNFDSEELLERYSAFYKNEPFVRVVGDAVPDLKKAVKTPYCFIGGFDAKEEHCVIVSVIDNLQKGAASMAVQNMNIMYGLDETTGLKGSGRGKR